jgi:two-component system, OmpR family, sensor histidine kinase KdpD
MVLFKRTRRGEMSRIEPLLTRKPKEGAYWKWYLLDCLLALGSIFLLTGAIWLFHLYQRIPDSFLVYLLAILSLASLRGLSAALLASFIAFFSFDFFFVPPLYTLSVAKFEDVLTLIVFLVTAIITSQFASTLRQRAEDANRLERETHILYDLVRATNREEDLELQLSIFARAVVEVFSPWGIQDCLLLLPNEQGVLQLNENVELSVEERAIAQRIMTQPGIVDIPDGIRMRGEHANNSRDNAAPKTLSGFPVKRHVRLVPLKTNHQVVGILRLLIEHERQGNTINDILSLEHNHPTPDAVFFSTFLEQAVAVIERGHLRQENFRVNILKQTDTLRSALLSSVSHDLRTPLSTIKTAATSLLEDDVQWDKETQRGFMTAIEHEADRLNGLVENLLDMSRIEAGSLHPEKEWYPLDALLRDVLDRMQPLLEGRTVQVSLPDQIPPVELDAVLIEQVVTNLITNAAYYTPAGSPIDVCIQVRPDQLTDAQSSHDDDIVKQHIEGAQEAIIVSIADRGPGIALVEHEHIFDKFYRVLGQTQMSGEKRGSGLGLAICRGLVEAHSGRIWIESREGGGAVLSFTLPLSNTDELEL